MAALFALVMLPVLRTMQVRPLYDDMRTLTEPSRNFLIRVHVSLALEQSLLRDFLERNDSVAASRYRKAVEDERAAYAGLTPLVARLGPNAQSEFGQVRELERAWHAEIEKVLAAPALTRRARDPMHARIYEDLLLSTARLDETLDAASQSRRASIEAANRGQVWITFAVGAIALTAAVIVAWLSRRVRSFAVREEAARRELEEAIIARERLTRGITHDLKNPLQVILGGAELLAEEIAGPLNSAQSRTVKRIIASSNHLLSMVTDLLELSMATGGTLTIRPAIVSLAAIILETVSQYDVHARKSGLTLEVSIDDPLEVVTDPQRVTQILQNLISNAVKYTPSGGRILVTGRTPPAESVNDPRSLVAIEVSDTGDGIPSDQLESIFNEFSRLEGHRKIPGAGLGLAVARRISVLLGGNITVTSSASGSTFTLWLPRDRRVPSMDGGRLRVHKGALS